MGIVFSGVEGLKPPSFAASSGWTNYDKECEEYIAKVRKYAKAYSSCPEAGEEIRFPVADGQARYIVLSMRPLKLVHLDIGDGWHFQYVNRLTVVDVREKIEQSKALEKIFAERKVKGG